MDSIKKKMQSLATETANAQVLTILKTMVMVVKKMMMVTMVMMMMTLQARCERWEKEAASTNATADHLEDQVDGDVADVGDVGDGNVGDSDDGDD